MILDEKHTLDRMATAARSIYDHVAACQTCTCTGDQFGTIIAPIGCCDDARRLWRLHRRAVSDYAKAKRWAA